MPRKSPRESLHINKSLSLPIGLVNEILDESEVMGRDFSSTSVVLLRMGLALRRQQDHAEKVKIERGEYDH